jgi:hypothetical protein
VTSPLRLTISIFFFQLSTCGYSPYVTSSLTKGWVCCLQLLLALSSAVILRSESHGTHDHILQSQIQDPQPGGPGPHIYIPQEQGGPVIPPGSGIPFCHLLRDTGLWWRCSTSPSHRIDSDLILFCTTYIVSRWAHRKHICCLALDILYCWLHICCGLVYWVIP